MRTQVLRSGIAVTMTCALAWTMAWAGVDLASASESNPRFAISTLTAASTTSHLQTHISIDVKNHRLKDILTFIADATRIQIDPMWLSDRHAIGMDRDTRITLKASNISALSLLERVLMLATSDSTGAFGMTWQIGDNDTLQVGPRERLNAFRRVEIYDITDLLAITPDFTNPPGFDLNNILQSQNGRGGGSASSPFTPNASGNGNQPGNGVNGQPELTDADRANALRFIITQLVEPEQWEESGSTAASIRFYQGAFIVNAPDYVHRALGESGRTAR